MSGFLFVMLTRAKLGDFLLLKCWHIQDILLKCHHFVKIHWSYCGLLNLTKNASFSAIASTNPSANPNGNFRDNITFLLTKALVLPHYLSTKQCDCNDTDLMCLVDRINDACFQCMMKLETIVHLISETSILLMSP